MGNDYLPAGSCEGTRLYVDQKSDANSDRVLPTICGNKGRVTLFSLPVDEQEKEESEGFLSGFLVASATLYEGVSVLQSVGPSLRPSVRNAFSDEPNSSVNELEGYQ